MDLILFEPGLISKIRFFSIIFNVIFWIKIVDFFQK